MPTVIQPLRSLAFIYLLILPAAVPAADRMSYLNNGVIRLGVNLDLGGSITYLSASNSEESLVNNHDWGRQIQMSFYSGPIPFKPNGKEPAKAWEKLGWNTIQSGDFFGHRAHILEHRNDDKTLYLKCQPMQWPLDNEPADCTFETWIELAGKAAHVRCRLTNARADKTSYPARNQELPAVYTTSTYWRLMTYSGDNPFTGGELVRIDRKLADGGWANGRATECWSAMINDQDWGLGVYSPGNYEFIGGFHGTPKGPGTDPTGYISPVRNEVLDHNIVYDYDYFLILDSLKGIRQWVYDHAPRPAAPAWSFLKDRQHWIYYNASDAGWPLRGEWHVRLDQPDAQLVSPAFCCPADLAPRLRLEAAFTTAQKTATVFWRSGDKPFAEAMSATFPIIGDGQSRVYEVNLASHPLYQGVISGLRIDPVAAAEQDASVRIKSISWQ
jgi:hypothetical protein